MEIKKNLFWPQAICLSKLYKHFFGICNFDVLQRTMLLWKSDYLVVKLFVQSMPTNQPMLDKSNTENHTCG